MPAVHSMTMRADIERDVQTGTDAWRQSKEPSWSGIAYGVACLAYTSAKRQAVGAGGGGGGAGSVRTATIEDMRIMLPLGTDVAEKDRVAQVKDRAGAVLFDGPFYVESVQRRRTHLELMVKKAAA